MSEFVSSVIKYSNIVGTKECHLKVGCEFIQSTCVTEFFRCTFSVQLHNPWPRELKLIIATSFRAVRVLQRADDQ